jgi:hypothetical protein
MSESKKVKKESPVEAPPKYTRDKLLKCKALAKYQRDFVSVALKEREYTIPEAIKAVETVLKERSH